MVKRTVLKISEKELLAMKITGEIEQCKQCREWFMKKDFFNHDRPLRIEIEESKEK